MLLSDIEKQEFDKAKVEVIIVSSGDGELEKGVIKRGGKLEVKHFHSKKRIGSSTARNRCIEASTGKFLIFLDDDVRLNTDFLEECKKYAKKYECFCFRIKGAKSNIMEKKFLGKIFLPFGLIFGGFNGEGKKQVQVMHFPGCFFVSKKCVGITKYDKYWEKGNGYLDDCDFSYSLHEKGCRLYYIPRHHITHLLAPTGGYREPEYRKWLYYYWNHKAYFIKNHARHKIYLSTAFLPNLLECLYICTMKRKLFVKEFVNGWLDGLQKIHRY